jgi:hypothetical protein
MDYNEIWKSTEVEGVSLRIINQNTDGSINVSFDFNHIGSENIHKYQRWYIEKYYELTDVKHSWVLDKRLKRIP